MRTIFAVIALLCVIPPSFAWDPGKENNTWVDIIGPTDSDEAVKITLKIQDDKTVEMKLELICESITSDDSGVSPSNPTETYVWTLGDRTADHTFCNGQERKDAIPPFTETMEMESYPVEVHNVLKRKRPPTVRPFEPAIIAGS
jgi:hypothetical protein